MRGSRWRRLGSLVVAVMALGALGAGPAGAQVYPGDEGARNFDGGVGNWTSSSTFTGTCLSPLLCPDVTNSHVAAGGSGGGGFIRSAYTGVAGVRGVGGTATGIWESPQFTYNGAGGNDATSVEFSMDRRADVDEILAVAGNTATFTVELINVSASNAPVQVIGESTLAGAADWTTVTATLAADSLKHGDNYRVRISSAYNTGTSVLVSGGADYDNVALEATRRGSGKGAGGKDGSDGSRLTESSLRSMLLGANSGSVTLKGKNLFVRVKCPKKVGKNCRMSVQAFLKKKKPATKRQKVKVRKGKAKMVKLKVKPKFRKKLQRRKRVLVRQKVRAGKVRTTINKRRKLIRR